MEPLEIQGFSSTVGCGGIARLFHRNGGKKVIHNPHRVFHGEKSENVENLAPGMWAAGRFISPRTAGYFLVLMLVVMAFTVSAKAASLVIRCSTCSMECITVVWSRPPNSLPMSA